MEIKWRRLRKIAEDLTGEKVVIMGTTDIKDDAVHAVVAQQGSTVQILLNLNTVKSESMVLAAIAHELTHVLLGSNEHGGSFEDKRREVRRTLTKRYGEE